MCEVNGKGSLAHRLNGSRGQGSGLPSWHAACIFRSPLVHLGKLAFALRRKMQVALDGQARWPSG